MSQQSAHKIHFRKSGNSIFVLTSTALFLTIAPIHPALCQTANPMSGMDMGSQKQDTTKDTAQSQSAMNMGKQDMDIVHPFFTHMGMPDPVGHYVMRLSGVSTLDDGRNRGDFGFHLETGLAKRVGLHVRNDRISHNDHTEIAFQYAALQARNGMSGLSPFVELEVPTHQGEQHTYGLVGFSTMWSSPKVEVNQSAEYSPRESALEGSVSVVAKVAQRLFPVGEFIFTAAKDAQAKNTVLGGLKYRVNRSTVFGVGYQVPVTRAKDFTHQILVQTDLEW